MSGFTFKEKFCVAFALLHILDYVHQYLSLELDCRLINK